MHLVELATRPGCRGARQGAELLPLVLHLVDGAGVELLAAHHQAELHRAELLRRRPSSCCR
ncbi:MAG: hypothetical protein V4795_00510 [Pseudomonadota bacterium]